MAECKWKEQWSGCQENSVVTDKLGPISLSLSETDERVALCGLTHTFHLQRSELSGQW